MGREPFVAVVVVGRIVVVAVRSWIVRAIVIVIASPISTRVVSVGSFDLSLVNILVA